MLNGEKDGAEESRESIAERAGVGVCVSVAYSCVQLFAVSAPLNFCNNTNKGKKCMHLHSTKTQVMWNMFADATNKRDAFTLVYLPCAAASAATRPVSAAWMCYVAAAPR
ncbi:hypothetical protein VNO80_21975 [Phaseolus coccineus]|uniref:Uncharacterized protein n=1 Tax=Phaseolus coccineus TaxID=3886 RepID=A0AAN9M3A6_PHACN